MNFRKSGAKWTDRLPAHWGEARMRFVAAINPSKSELAHVNPDTEVSFLPMEAVGEDGAVDQTRTRPIAEVSNGYTYFRERDVLVAKITPCFENGKAAQVAGLKNGIGFGSTEFHVLRARKGLNDRFLFHLVRSQMFKDFGTASMYGAGGQKRVPTEFVADFVVPLPPSAEQAAIASFLDHEIKAIDQLINAQSELKACLEEKRDLEVASLLTGGVDFSTFDTDSISDWAKYVPSDWRLVRLKDICKAIIDCKNRTPPPSDNGAYFVVRTSCLRKGKFDPSGGYLTDERAFREWTKKGLPKEGDVFISREAPMGEACLHPADRELCLGQRMMLARADTTLTSAEYILLSIYAPIGREYIELRKKGSTVGHLRVGEVLNFPVLLPPRSVQNKIVRRVRATREHFDALSGGLTTMISALNERRAAIVSAAVSGQIDVLKKNGSALTT